MSQTKLGFCTVGICVVGAGAGAGARERNGDFCCCCWGWANAEGRKLLKAEAGVAVVGATGAGASHLLCPVTGAAC